MELLFKNKVTDNREEFAEKMETISAKLGTIPDWLMFLMDFESAETFSASEENPFGCIGLIQFCPDFSGADYKTINGVQYKMSVIKSMSNVEQLTLVYEYLKLFKGDIQEYYDLYFAILCPDMLGKPDDYSNAGCSRNNLVFDMNSNKSVTVGEVKKFLDERVKNKVPPSYWNLFFKKKRNFLQIYQREIFFWGGIIILLILLYVVYRKIMK